VPDYIEIKLTKQRLFLTENELMSLLATEPKLWQEALKRGKGIQRYRQAEAREMKVTAGREIKSH